MQLKTITDINDDVYSGKLCVSSYTCLEQSLIEHHGPPTVDTGGEFATIFEDFASRDYTVNSQPAPTDIMQLIIDSNVTTFEFVTVLGDEQVGNIGVVIGVDEAGTATNLAAALDGTEFYTAAALANVISVEADIAGDIADSLPASITSSNIVLYQPPVNYYTLPSCIVELYQNVCIESKQDVNDIMVELNIDQAAARDEAAIRIDLWVNEMKVRITAEIDALRGENPYEFISKTEETI